MFLHIYHKTLGGHVHCRVFVGHAAGFNPGKSGDLVFRVSEWPKVLDKLRRIAEVIAE
jgi:hypothetical protein